MELGRGCGSAIIVLPGQQPWISGGTPHPIGRAGASLSLTGECHILSGEVKKVAQKQPFIVLGVNHTELNMDFLTVLGYSTNLSLRPNGTAV
jgi:hypothetical protein